MELNFFVTPGYEHTVGYDPGVVFDGTRATGWAPNWNDISPGVKMFAGAAR